MPQTALLVEDDARTRARLAAAISTIAGMQLLASVGSCAEARRELSRSVPDVLLLDLGLPDGDGAELIPEALRAGAKILILSVFSDGPQLRAALAAGAGGFLLKDSGAREICRAIIEGL